MDALKINKIYNTFSVDNIQQAYDFYSGCLLIDVTREPLDTLKLNLPGNTHGMIIYARENHQPAEYTMLNFDVDDIEAAVDEFTERGIIFEHYEGAMATDKKGIFRSPEVDLAWFKDPAGNICCLIKNN